jgi:16S rRNA G966 N2-methylase RsmD
LASNEHRLEIPAQGPRYSHYAFRYPAKFHPPVVQALLDKFVDPEGLVLDNFCGSGTTLVEASVSGRRSVGLDIDPVAVLVSRAKTRRYESESLTRDAARLVGEIRGVERSPSDYDDLIFTDISADTVDDLVRTEGLWLPKIPRLSHWFRNYVSVDLARILAIIQVTKVSEENRILFLLAFASTIRNVSNADPVPVSGLEVTSHMLRKDAAGRRINPFDVFVSRLRKTVDAVVAFSQAITPEVVPEVIAGDATHMPSDMPRGFDAVIASPPYHNAVDYYRRHQLEMYWLGLVQDHAERLELLPKYIGRHRIPAKHAAIQGEWQPGPVADLWFQKMAAADTSRATDFRHYLVSMQKVFGQLHSVVHDGAPVIMVVGDSAWRGETIPTTAMMAEVAAPFFELQETMWYPIKNRYMSYSRHNGADIGQEKVLVFR